MTGRSFGTDRILLLAVSAVALFVRLHGISWGLPEVYEEATPLHEAWQIGGWGPFNSFDLNPHFFRYPSFVLYVHAAAQAILYVVLSLAGTIDSTLDFRALFALDRTVFYVLGRSITALFGAGTVALTYVLASRVAGTSAGVLAALFLALNPLHVAESQTIGVDVPLTFFATWALVEALRIASAASRGPMIRAGIAMGLAASSKYTGAILIVPLLAAVFLAPRRSRASLGLLVLPAFAAFACTSPFVLLDFSSFWRDFRSEGEHMAVGHFGDEASGSVRLYASALSTDALGWPLLAASAASLAFFALIQRRRWAWILGSFVAAYFLLISTWTMRADRYLLPVVPPLLVFAAALFPVIEKASSPRWAGPLARRAVLGAAAFLILLTFLQVDLALWRERARDTRTEAKQWIEAHCPTGAFLLTEPYGPDLFDALEIALLDPDVRVDHFDRLENRSLYGMLQLPMFQVGPERSAPYYDLALYQDVDLVLTTSKIRSRYVENRSRFPKQSAFYDSLEASYRKIQEFEPGDGGGPHLILYARPRAGGFFAYRKAVAGPASLSRARAIPATDEAYFFYQWAMNYEVFGFVDPALRAYAMAEQSIAQRPSLARNVALGIARCLSASGNRAAAIESLQRARSKVKNDSDRRALLDFERILADSSPTANARK